MNKNISEKVPFLKYDIKEFFHDELIFVQVEIVTDFCKWFIKIRCHGIALNPKVKKKVTGHRLGNFLLGYSGSAGCGNSLIFYGHFQDLFHLIT